MIPTVNKSCCSLSLRTGSIVIAVAFMILTLLDMAWFQGYLGSSEDKDTDKDSGRLARTFDLIYAVLFLVVCVIVLVGVFMRMSILLLICGIAFFISAVIDLVLGLLGFIDTGELLDLIFNVLNFLLHLYCGVVLWSHGKELE